MTFLLRGRHAWRTRERQVFSTRFVLREHLCGHHEYVLCGNHVYVLRGQYVLCGHHVHVLCGHHV